MVGVRGAASFSIRLVRKKDVSGIWPKNIGPLESCLTFPFFFFLSEGLFKSMRDLGNITLVPER